jgi:hypothetical protein
MMGGANPGLSAVADGTWGTRNERLLYASADSPVLMSPRLSSPLKIT